MNIYYFTKSENSARILIASLTVAIVCMLVPGTGSRASSIADEWDEVFDTARAVLAHMPEVDRIETIKDVGLREAMLRAYRALKACAKVNKDQSRAVKQAAVAEFERAFKSVQTEAERGEYRDCASKCKTDRSKCEKDCATARKKLCACKMSEFGCFATQCLFA
ncbi:MAG: hypothetical protein AABN33_02880 [Acidobacteriota bacterium]